MRKALREADLGVAEMADYLGVARGSVSNWINGRISPSVQTLRLWAMRCGVPYEWLVSGGVPQQSQHPASALRARQDSNLQPSDPHSVHCLRMAPAA